jgi:hypothetical protein
MSTIDVVEAKDTRSKDELWAAVKKHRAEGTFAQTLPLLQELCARHPDEHRFVVCFAEALQLAHRQDEAKLYLQRAVALDPHDTRSAARLAQLQAAADSGGPDPSDVAAAKQKLIALHEAGRDEQVVADYHALILDKRSLVTEIEDWSPIVNGAGAAVYRAHGETPGAVAQGIIQEVNERGIAIRSFDEVFRDRGLLAELINVVATTTDWYIPGKGHFIKALKENPVVTPGSHPVMRSAFDEVALEAANGFYGLYSRVVSANIVLTKTKDLEGRKRQSSEGWHRDPEDTPMFKSFIYLNDVLDLGHGPFQYIPDSRKGGRYERLLTRFGRGLYDPSYKTRPDWSEVDREVAPEDIVTVTGKAGTMFFCNTSGFHRGGFCTTQDRYMVANVYQRPGSQFPSYVKTDIDPGTASMAVRMAVSQAG